MSRLAQGKVSEHGEDARSVAAWVQQQFLYSTIFIHIPPYSTYAYLMLCWYYLRFFWGFGKHSSLHVRPFAPLSQQIWIGIPWNTTIVWSRQNESGSSRFLLQTTSNNINNINYMLNPSESKPKQTVFGCATYEYSYISNSCQHMQMLSDFHLWLHE
jgi:hypothetical protein